MNAKERREVDEGDDTEDGRRRPLQERFELGARDVLSCSELRIEEGEGENEKV